MKKTFIACACAVFLAALSIPGAASADSTDKFSQTYTLSPDGRFSVANISGHIRVTPWDQDNILVEAVKNSDRDDDLDRVKIEVDATSNSLEIRTRYPRRCDCDVSVDYDIKVPRTGSAYDYRLTSVSGEVEISGVGGKFKASSVSGNVKIQDVSGSVTASSVSGDVKVDIAQLRDNDDLELSSVSGDVRVGVPAGLDADVRMNTFSGDVEADFPLMIEGKQRRFGGGISGQIGRGGRTLAMKSVSGNLSLRRR